MTDTPKPWPSAMFAYPDGRPGDLVEQSDPDYAFRETGRWNGMTREETTKWLAEMRKESAQRQMLYHFVPASPPN